MANEPWREYLELALGITEASRKKAAKAVKRLAGKGGATAEQLQTLAEDLFKTNVNNRDALLATVRNELDRALARIGLVKSEEVEELTRRIKDLERRLGEAGRSTSSTPLIETEPEAVEAEIESDVESELEALAETAPAAAGPAGAKGQAAPGEAADGAAPATRRVVRKTAKKAVKKAATKATRTARVPEPVEVEAEPAAARSTKKAGTTTAKAAPAKTQRKAPTRAAKPAATKAARTATKATARRNAAEESSRGEGEKARGDSDS
jgi:polyhydroxyalkanoate synthesis regulator phasin